MPDPLPDAWLARDPLPGDPLPILKRWLDEAFAAAQQPNPHAIALATADADGTPSVRMVLCKEIDVARGALVFYTDRSSRKGRELAARPRAAAVFYWPGPGRQARVEGAIEPTADADSDAYFASRPLDARLAARASDQSRPIASRAALLEKLAAVEQRFGGAGGPAGEVPRPDRWGGYVLAAERVELWVSRPARVHDRALWSRSAAGWRVERLQP